MAQTELSAAEADLEPRSGDYLAAALRGALGACPIVGPALSEMAGVVQKRRIDRVVAYITCLNQRLVALEKDCEWLKNRLRDHHAYDLVVEGARQSCISPDDLHYQRAAAIVSTGLALEDPVHAELSGARIALRLLAELSSLDIFVLCSHLSMSMSDAKKFYKRFLPPQISDRAFYEAKEWMDARLHNLGLLTVDRLEGRRVDLDRLMRNRELTYDFADRVPYTLAPIGRRLLEMLDLDTVGKILDGRSQLVSVESPLQA